MNLKPNTERALKAWLAPSTWDSDHPSDMYRWYDFVNQYQKEHGFVINEIDLRDHIQRSVKGTLGAHQQEVIKKRVSFAIDILNFLKHTGR